MRTFIFDRIFSQKSSQQQQKQSFSSLSTSTNSTKKSIIIYLDPQLKRKLQTHNQTYSQYKQQNQFDSHQYIYIMIKHKKTQQIHSKRKLNSYEWFSDCLQQSLLSLSSYNNNSQQYKSYLVMGYEMNRNSSIPKRLSSTVPFTDNLKCIRSGTLMIYSEELNHFEECQLKLYQDYLTYMKNKVKQKKVSFIPLENSIVQTISQNKYVFIIKDKFKNIMFKTTSKQDMIGWLLAISQAIKIRSSQIYLTQFDQKLSKSIKDKLNSYQSRCNSLKQQSKLILLDEIGRKAIKNYMISNKNNKNGKQIDLKMLKIIQKYVQMCKIRRQKGEQYCQSIIGQLKVQLQQIFMSQSNTSSQLSPHSLIKPRQLSSNHELIKSIQQIMKHLNSKYKKQIFQNKHIFHVYQYFLTEQYKKKSKINVKSYFGHVEVNSNKEKKIGEKGQKSKEDDEDQKIMRKYEADISISNSNKKINKTSSFVFTQLGKIPSMSFMKANQQYHQ